MKQNELLEIINPTTFIQSSKLCDFLKLDITIASETFQHTGSFKFRAAYNLASNVQNNEILTASSGNFGQALAYACQLLGKKCTVVMPETSTKVKIEAVRGFGATVELVDTAKTSRVERVRQLAEQMPNAYVASAYDDEFIIDGNATIGTEIAANEFDIVIVPVGGGGLISGIGKAFSQLGCKTEIIAAEPLLGNDATRSFRTGQLIANQTEPMTIADGARTVSLGNLNWAIIKDTVTDFIEVSEDKIAAAVKIYFQLVNLKCEPTGALSLGAVLENTERFIDKKICLIVSGGNVDAFVYIKLLAD